MVGPMARPGARGLGPGLGLKYEIVLWAGPGLDIIVAGRAGPGLIIQFAGRARARSAQLLRARAGPGLQIMFPGLGLDFRPVQGPSVYTVHTNSRWRMLTAQCPMAPHFKYSFFYLNVLLAMFSTGGPRNMHFLRQ